MSMFNMKKLIDETDFDNLNNLTKQWKGPEEAKETHKENQSIRSNEKEEARIQKNSKPSVKTQPEPEVTLNKRRNIVPQVMDEDTEHFKNKLEHLLNNFKTDAVSEFMSMKKDMLEYQQECVKGDTHKYLTMYEEKHQELLQTKQKLLAMSKEAEKKTIQVQLLSEHIAKLNEKVRITKYLSRPFSILYQNKEHEKMMKFKEKQARVFDEKRLKRKAVWGWTKLYKENKSEAEKVATEERIEKEVNQIVGRFQKEMELLKERLEEATRKNEDHENNKHLLQENLKKAFLRGVCAMNMEAMGVLGSQNAEDAEWASEKQKGQNEQSYIATNLSYVDQRSNREEVPQNQSMYTSKAQTATKMNSTINQGRRSEVIVNPPKAESKNHKWKEAPIMGVEERIQSEEPRMQIVRPTTEGKVIKVVDGRSAVQTGVTKTHDACKKGPPSDRFSAQGSSRKKM